MSTEHTAENDARLTGLEEACLEGLVYTPFGYRYRPADGASAVRAHVIDGMTVPPGGPDDAFWQGAQWAYGQVREALDERPAPPAKHEHPCPSQDCPGDGRYAPPGRGHVAGCGYPTTVIPPAESGGQS